MRGSWEDVQKNHQTVFFPLGANSQSLWGGREVCFNFGGVLNALTLDDNTAWSCVHQFSWQNPSNWWKLTSTNKLTAAESATQTKCNQRPRGILFIFQNQHQSFSTDHCSSDRLYLLTVHWINVSVAFTRVCLLLYHGFSFRRVLKHVLAVLHSCRVLHNAAQRWTTTTTTTTTTDVGHPFCMCFSMVINSAPVIRTLTHALHMSQVQLWITLMSTHRLGTLSMTAHTLFDTVFLQWTNNTNRTPQVHRDADALCCEWHLVCVFCDTVTSHPRPVSILPHGSARVWKAVWQPPRVCLLPSRGVSSST